MKNVFLIFGGDLRKLSKQFFALVIAVALALIPALYSWFNLYANWDPYSKTGKVPFAVASDDLGYTTEDGVKVNKSMDVLDELSENESIGWVILDSSEEAIAGVESGDYYAALVFHSNFTENMYDIETAITNSDSTITLYENGKKNPVAQKIVESAAATVTNNIRQTYLEVIFEEVFGRTNEMGQDIADAEAVDTVVEALGDLQDNMAAYDLVIEHLLSNDETIDYLLNDGYNQIEQAKNISEDSIQDINDAKKVLADSRSLLNDSAESIEETMDEISDNLDDLSKTIRTLGSDIKETAVSTEELLQTGITEAEMIEEELELLISLIPPGDYSKEIQYAADTLDAMLINMKSIENDFSKLVDNGDYGKNLSDICKSSGNIVSITQRMLVKTVIPAFDNILSDAENTLDMTVPLIESANVMLADFNPVLDDAVTAKGGIYQTLGQLQLILRAGSDSLDDAIEKINSGKADELVDALINVLGGEPEAYAQFLAAPVQVKNSDIYPVNYYGMAMMPFYSTLAIWVGGVMLVAIFKVEPDTERLTNVKESQRYFGKLLLFLMMGQLQALAIVLSDLYLLPAQCMHPFLFWVAASVTSFVFTTLIYSLTLAFGDVGKAIVVVIMVVQIAGSSGSYPIELLPGIFSSIYLFFPFPYAINAMREAICGLYGNEFIIYLAELCIFAIASIFVGLVIRRPFIGVKHFMEEEMEETGIL